MFNSIHLAPPKPGAAHRGEPRSGAWQVEVFYDGDCPLCMREMRMLMRRDRRGAILFTDIAADGFDAAAPGLDRAALMQKIHGRLPTGEILEGVEVFRRLYAAVGFGRLVRLSRAPGVAWLLDRVYAWFAKNRLRLTGRCEAGVCSAAGRPSAAA